MPSQNGARVIPPQRPAVDAPVYAVVEFDGPERRVSAVVVAFENVPAADRFALEQGLADYTVAPIGFHIDPPPGLEKPDTWR